MEETNKTVEVPAKFKSIVESIETMSVLDLNELVKLFEDKFGVSAAAVAAPAQAAAAVEEKDSFTVVLASFGEAKIPVMKVVKEALGLGLKDAKKESFNIPEEIQDLLEKRKIAK